MAVKVRTPDWARQSPPPPTNPQEGVPPDVYIPWYGYGSQAPLTEDEVTFVPGVYGPGPVQQAQARLNGVTSFMNIPPGLRIAITDQQGGITLPRGAVVDMRRLDITKLSMFLRKRGTLEWVIEYPAWQVDTTKQIVFLFDPLFYALPKARYEAELRYNGLAIGALELDYRDYVPLRLTPPGALERHTHAYPQPPEGVTDVYQAVQTFSAPLTATLEVGTQTLIFGPTDTDTLVALVLAKPVQLEVSDGSRTEIVEYAGPQDGAVVVTRGAAGSTQYRFPAGSTVSFKWTEQNVTNAMAGP